MHDAFGTKIYQYEMVCLTMIYTYSCMGLPEGRVEDHQIDVADRHSDNHDGEANLRCKSRSKSYYCPRTAYAVSRAVNKSDIKGSRKEKTKSGVGFSRRTNIVIRGKSHTP